MNTKLLQLIRDGEGLTVEFKRCKDNITHTVYETVCSFSNRYGGYILLGVEDDGTVSGIEPDAVRHIKKDFANSLNNPQRFSPTLFITLEEAEVYGKIVLWCYVPLGSPDNYMGDMVSDNDQVSDKMSDNNQMNEKTSDKMSDNDQVSEKTSDNDKMSDKMSDKTTRDAMLTYLRGNGEVTAAEAAKIINRSAQTARRVLSRLVTEGVIVASGANRNRKYKAK